MEARLLGSTGLRVSVLSFGSLTFGRQGKGSLGCIHGRDAEQLVQRCIERGVNLFDTADIYDGGRSEEILGQALGSRRADVFVATKVCGPTGDGPDDRGLSRQHIVKACESSLRRLGTDYVDFYQAHGYDACTPVEETLRALDDLVRQGKVRYLGCCNFSGWQLMKSLAASRHGGSERYVLLQAEYSLLSRGFELELGPLCADAGVGVLAWGALAAGLLAGRHAPEEPPRPGSRLAAPGSHAPVEPAKARSILAELKTLAAEKGATPAQVALSYVLAKPTVTSVLLGCRTLQQLDENLGAADCRLTPPELERLDRVSEPALPYPYWHQRFHG